MVETHTLPYNYPGIVAGTVEEWWLLTVSAPEFILSPFTSWWPGSKIIWCVDRRGQHVCRPLFVLVYGSVAIISGYLYIAPSFLCEGAAGQSSDSCGGHFVLTGWS